MSEPGPFIFPPGVLPAQMMPPQQQQQMMNPQQQQQMMMQQQQQQQLQQQQLNMTGQPDHTKGMYDYPDPNPYRMSDRHKWQIRITWFMIGGITMGFIFWKLLGVLSRIANAVAGG